MLISFKRLFGIYERVPRKRLRRIDLTSEAVFVSRSTVHGRTCIVRILDAHAVHAIRD